MTEEQKVRGFESVACSYCGAERGERCRVTMLPEGRQRLSVPWVHRAREAAVR